MTPADRMVVVVEDHMQQCRADNPGRLLDWRAALEPEGESIGRLRARSILFPWRT